MHVIRMRFHVLAACDFHAILRVIRHAISHVIPRGLRAISRAIMHVI